MLSCEAAGGEPEHADPLALSVELLHTFSLVHDDLMDRDEVRRGVPTVHLAYDEATAILAGDALYALSFEVLSKLEHGPSMEILGDVARTARRLCEGQQSDMDFEGAWPDVDAYEAMIGKKTAALFACASGNGARIAGADARTVEALERFGRTLGTGFQVQDDLLDLVGEETTLGKPVGSDVRAGKKTHPILVAHERAGDEAAGRLRAILEEPQPTDEQVDWVLDLVARTDAEAASRERAHELFDEAHEAVASLPESDARAVLLDLIEWVRTRDR